MSSPITKKLTQQQAEAAGRALDVGLDTPICLACLSFVSMAIDNGDPKDIAAQVRWVTRDLWIEGSPGRRSLRRVGRSRPVSPTRGGLSPTSSEGAAGAASLARSCSGSARSCRGACARTSRGGPRSVRDREGRGRS